MPQGIILIVAVSVAQFKVIFHGKIRGWRDCGAAL
jgi:hypothetical protein